MFSYAFLMIDFWELKDEMSFSAGDEAKWRSTCLACHKCTEALGRERRRTSSILGVFGDLRNLHPVLHHSEYNTLILEH